MKFVSFAVEVIREDWKLYLPILWTLAKIAFALVCFVYVLRTAPLWAQALMVFLWLQNGIMGEQILHLIKERVR